METIYYIIFIVVLIFLLFFANKCENMQASGNDGSGDNYAKVGPYYDYMNSVIPEYNVIFRNFPFWYNKFTPLPWYNPTRFDNAFYYPYIQDYFYPRIRFY